MVMSEESSGKSFFVNWPVMVMYAGRFGKVIDSLEAKGCISKDSALETKKKITELQNLIDIVAVTHDTEKQNMAEDIFHAIMLTLFEALDKCFDKGLVYEVS
jgi:hypothetical protein